MKQRNPVMSWNQFIHELDQSMNSEKMRSLEGDLTRNGSKVRDDIREDNQEVEDKFPELHTIKPRIRQRSLFIDPLHARTHLRKLISKQGESEERETKQKVMEREFLEVITAVRGKPVKITEVHDGHRDDQRDKILKAQDEKTGEQVLDYRLLIGDPEKNGRDIRNDLSQVAFYKLLDLRTARVKGKVNIRPEDKDRDKDADASRRRRRRKAVSMQGSEYNMAV